jgi:hypothetical protein
MEAARIRQMIKRKMEKAAAIAEAPKRGAGGYRERPPTQERKGMGWAPRR